MCLNWLCDYVLWVQFHPFSINETGSFLMPGRREIGHGECAAFLYSHTSLSAGWLKSLFALLCFVIYIYTVIVGYYVYTALLPSSPSISVCASLSFPTTVTSSLPSSLPPTHRSTSREGISPCSSFAVSIHNPSYLTSPGLQWCVVHNTCVCMFVCIYVPRGCATWPVDQPDGRLINRRPDV